MKRLIRLAALCLLIVGGGIGGRALPAAAQQPPGRAARAKPGANPAAVTTAAQGNGRPSDVSHKREAQDYFYDLRNPAVGGPAGPNAAQASRTPRAVTQQQAARLPGASVTVGGTWTPVGGNAALGGQIPGGGAVSGRVYAVVPDPADTSGNTIYVGAAMGGVWKTTNKGQSWTPLTDQQPSLAITAIVLDPTNTQKVYAATGDPTYTNQGFGSFSYFGAGILFSADGGATWSTIGASTFTGVAIFDMAINPAGTQLYVTAINGLYIGTLSGGTWTFTRRGTGTWTSVRVNPGNADIVNLGGYGGPWVYRPSINSLTASAFCLSSTDCTTPIPIAPANVGRTTIAEDSLAVNANYVYASMACNTASGVCPGVNCSTGTCPAAWWGLWESTDFGASFHPLVLPFPSVGTYEYSQSFYDITAAVDPTDDNIVYFGLVSMWSYSYLTNTVSLLCYPGATDTNNCQAWGTGRFGLPAGVHADQHAIGFDSAGTLYIGNDGGVFSSPPGSFGGRWNNLNSNLYISQFYPGVAYNPANPSRLLGGTQDNGTQTWDGTAWRVTNYGDGGPSGIDAADPTNTWYASYVHLRVLKTTNGSTVWSSTTGPTWTVVIQGMLPDGNGGEEGEDDGPAVYGSLFIAPYTIDPTNHLNLLAGADRPYRSTNGAASWTDISGNGFAPLSGGASISAATICPDPTNGGIFYLGTNSGRIFKTTNGFSGSPVWSEISTGLPGQWVTRIVCSPTDATVYATVGGAQTTAGTHVFKRGPSDTTWTSIQGNLPNTSVMTLAIDSRTSPATLYTATDLGVYTSADGGASWARYGSGLPNVVVADLVFDPSHNVMYAATHGRGIWSIPVAGGGTPGGTGFGIAGSPGSVAMTWNSGTGQTGYVILRIPLTGETPTALPPGGTLPATATSYTDTTTGGGVFPCYLLLALGGPTGVLGNSDMLCTVAGLRSGTPPANFTLRLNQSSTASLSWTALTGATSYTLYAVPLTGGAVRTQNLPAGTTSATDATGGAFTCYLLVANGVASNISDMLCGIPGISSFGPSAATAGITSLDQAARRAAQAVPAAAVQDAIRKARQAVPAPPGRGRAQR